MNKNAKFLLKERYCKPGENPLQVYSRVSEAISLGDSKFEKNLFHIMKNGYFLPASPTIRNAGVPKTLLHPCHVLPIEDSIESIMDCLKNCAIVFHHGGGVGFNISQLRPMGAKLSSGGESSGVVSFLKLFNNLTDIVKQGAFRRGALMGALDYNHPEILTFVTSKLTGDLTNFNISVSVTDEFMTKVTTEDSIDLVFNGDKWNSIKARDLFDQIVFSAYCCGGPGLLFVDRINRDNKLYPKVKINATNPCLSGDTLVSTTEGEISIKDLAKRRSRSADVYCMVDGKLSILRGQNIRVTRGQGARKEKMVEVRTSKGFVRCTPDHKIFTKNRGWVESGLLEKGDCLVELCKSKRGSRYVGVRLGIQDSSEEQMEHRFVAGYYYGDLSNFDIHHIDGNTHNNSIENLQALPHGIHARVQRNDNKDVKKTKDIRSTGRMSVESRVISVEESEPGVVYDMEVPGANNFIVNGFVVHNCGEVPLPEWTCCNLGAVNLSKFVTNGGSFNLSKYSDVVSLGIRALKNINAIGWYPFQEMNRQMKLLDPCGLGHFGLADALIKMSVKYDSEETLKFIEEIAGPYVKITNKMAKNSFWKRSQQPTGSLSILADCSPGIEPVFARAFERNLKIGVIEEVRDIYKSKYCRTAHEISPEWHLKVQAKFQEYVDAGVSKTVNLPQNAAIDEVRQIYYKAWEMGCKGITVFRENCKEGVFKRIKCDDAQCYL